MEKPRTLDVLRSIDLDSLFRNFQNEKIDSLPICKGLNDRDLSNLGLETIGDKTRFRSAIDIAITTKHQAQDQDSRARNVTRERNLLFLPGRSRQSHLQARKKKGRTWTATFLCLSVNTQEKVPNSAEKECLFKAGLGLKKICLNASDKENEVYQTILKEFPKLESIGGFELMCCSTTCRTLRKIDCKWDVKNLKSVVGPQGKFYIRPIQGCLALDVEKIEQNDSVSELKVKCKMCRNEFAINIIREHIHVCGKHDGTNFIESEIVNQIIHDGTQLTALVTGSQITNDGTQPVTLVTGSQISNDGTQPVTLVTGSQISNDGTQPVTLVTESKITNDGTQPVTLVTESKITHDGTQPLTSMTDSQVLHDGPQSSASVTGNQMILGLTQPDDSVIRNQIMYDGNMPVEQLTRNQIMYGGSQPEIPLMGNQIFVDGTHSVMDESNNINTLYSRTEDMDIHTVTKLCIDGLTTNNISDPVEILRYIQKQIVCGRKLDISNEEIDNGETMEGETNFIAIDREHVLESAMENIGCLDNLRLTLEVQFSGEVAVDFGGPRKEFFSLVLPEIYEKYFDPMKDYLAEDYECIGKIFASSILQNGKLPRIFNEHLLNELMTPRPSSPVFYLRKGMNAGLIEIIQAHPMLVHLITIQRQPLSLKMLSHILTPIFSDPGSNRRRNEGIIYQKFVKYMREVYESENLIQLFLDGDFARSDDSETYIDNKPKIPT